jgi:hypothetical protein
MTPEQVLAALSVPEGDTQRMAVFAVLNSEIAQAEVDQLDFTVSDSELRSRIGFLAGMKRFKEVLANAYEKANSSPKARKAKKKPVASS